MASGGGGVYGFSTFDCDTYGDQAWERITLGKSVLLHNDQQNGELHYATVSLTESILRTGNLEHPKPKEEESSTSATFDEDGKFTVRNLSLKFIRQKLITHFDIKVSDKLKVVICLFQATYLLVCFFLFTGLVHIRRLFGASKYLAKDQSTPIRSKAFARHLLRNTRHKYISNSTR